MDPGTTNCVILRILVDKKFLAMPSSDELVQGMGVKNIFIAPNGSFSPLNQRRALGHLTGFPQVTWSSK